MNIDDIRSRCIEIYITLCILCKPRNIGSIWCELISGHKLWIVLYYVTSLIFQKLCFMRRNPTKAQNMGIKGTVSVTLSDLPCEKGFDDIIIYLFWSRNPCKPTNMHNKVVQSIRKIVSAINRFYNTLLSQ